MINKSIVSSLVVVEGREFQNLPQDCIATVLSFTTPRDACRLSWVSSTFRSASQSDVVWDRFLPSDNRTIISQSSEPLFFASKKQLYLNLCQKPVLVDQVKRFSEVAELVSVCWLEIRGWIYTGILSHDTLYGANLVFNPSSAGSCGFENQSVEVSVGIVGGDTHKRPVFLDDERGRRLRFQIVPCCPHGIGIFGRTQFFEAPAPAPAEMLMLICIISIRRRERMGSWR